NLDRFHILIQNIENTSILTKERSSMVTIRQIAEEAGVSTATVSRVFGNHPNVKVDVKERVFAVARAHGYFPRLSIRRRNVVLITPSWAEYPVQNYVE